MVLLKILGMAAVLTVVGTVLLGSMLILAAKWQAKWSVAHKRAPGRSGL